MMHIISTLNQILGFQNHPLHHIISIALTFLTFTFILLKFFITKFSCKVYLLDFACYKSPKSCMCSRELAVEKASRYGFYSEETLDFMKKSLQRSGLGDSTYLAEGLLREPINICMKDERREAEMTIFGSIDLILKKSGVEPKEIGILVVNCCVYNSVPSISSLIVNHYKLRDNILTYNLSGMGCSAGLIAIGLTKQLLQVHKNSCALVVSTEIISDNFYQGNDRSKFLINCIFRVGGAAILLSNRSSDQRLSKYQLLHTVHTQTANSDRSYNCIFQEEDEEGHLGVNITKDLLAAAVKTIELNLTLLGNLILPLSEKIRFLTNYISRKLFSAKIGPYIPDFNKAADHFFPHVGGKPVLDALQRSLGISDGNMEASRMTLYRFGNTSSSSIWYELAYAEAKGRIKKGDSVWQIAFGSGFKCSSVIWKALRTVNYDEANPWSEEIDMFPVNLDNKGSMPFFFEPPK